MSIEDDSIFAARPGDVYVDAKGGVWKIVGIIREPAVIAQQMTVEEKGERLMAGMSAPLWKGFKRVYDADGGNG